MQTTIYIICGNNVLLEYRMKKNPSIIRAYSDFFLKKIIINHLKLLKGLDWVEVKKEREKVRLDSCDLLKISSLSFRGRT